MRIRRYEPRDASGVSAVYRRSVEALGVRHYSADQVAAWASLTPDPDHMQARLGDGRVVLVAVDAADQPVGFIDLEDDGHIDLLYCAPEVVGAGVAAALYEAVEADARQRGMPRLYAEASEAALRFFVKRGFTKLDRRDLKIGAVEIHNYAVEKVLK